MFRKMTLFMAVAAASLAFAGADASVSTEPETRTPKPMLKVLCMPKSVALNTPFYVNLEYAAPFSRPMAIHVDLLNADTNEWQAGDVVKVTGAAGKVTSRIVVPQDAKTPFKWFAYIAPQDENWPNMLATTTFTADLGAKVMAPCAPLRNTARSPSKPVDFDYVLVKDYPSAFHAGAKTPVEVQYNLMPDQPSMYVSATLLRSSDNTVVVSAQEKAKEGEHDLTMFMDVPADALMSEPVYLMAVLKPAGKAFSERVAEDRVWATSVWQQRRMLRAGAADN
jgi:hypothetical protein